MTLDDVSEPSLVRSGVNLRPGSVNPLEDFFSDATFTGDEMVDDLCFLILIDLEAEGAPSLVTPAGRDSPGSFPGRRFASPAENAGAEECPRWVWAPLRAFFLDALGKLLLADDSAGALSLIHISEPTRRS